MRCRGTVATTNPHPITERKSRPEAIFCHYHQVHKQFSGLAVSRRKKFLSIYKDKAVQNRS